MLIRYPSKRFKYRLGKLATCAIFLDCVCFPCTIPKHLFTSDRYILTKRFTFPITLCSQDLENKLDLKFTVESNQVPIKKHPSVLGNLQREEDEDQNQVGRNKWRKIFKVQKEQNGRKKLKTGMSGSKMQIKSSTYIKPYHTILWGLINPKMRL